MAPLLTIAKLSVAFLGLVTAAPYDLIAKIPLDDRDVSGCPATLPKGQYITPSSLTHISKKNPNKYYGTSNQGIFTPNDIGTIISFDVPAARMNDTCTLEFIFPKQKQLDSCNRDLVYRGPGSFFFTGYNPGSCPDGKTTYNNQPVSGLFPPFPPLHMEPGFRYIIDAGPCKFSAGSCAAGYTYTNDTTFIYTQSTAKCPIGLYTTFSSS